MSINGTVTDDREIVIQLDLFAVDQSTASIQAVIDTGFNGYLTLPIDVLNELGASAAGIRRAELGDGNLVEMEVYVVNVRWHDEFRNVLALLSQAKPLVGMSLLWGSRVGFDAEDGGTVSIESM